MWQWSYDSLYTVRCSSIKTQDHLFESHDPKLLGPGRTLFICLLLCVALPVFYILAHLCVCSVNESKLYLFSVREGDALLSAQNSLIGKLKEACQMLGAKLEELAQSSRYKALSDHVYPIHFFIHYKLKPNKIKTEPNQVHARYKIYIYTCDQGFYGYGKSGNANFPRFQIVSPFLVFVLLSCEIFNRL